MGHPTIHDDSSSVYNNIFFPSQNIAQAPAKTENLPQPNDTHTTRLENTTYFSPNPTFTMNLIKANEAQLTLEITNDTKLKEYSNGSVLVYSSSTGKTRTYMSNGSTFEVNEDVLDKDSNTIFVNITGRLVTMGNNGGIVFNYSDNAMIQGGSGNNTIVIVNKIRTNINSGDGDDTVIGKNEAFSSVKIGNTNNNIQIGNFLKAKLLLEMGIKCMNGNCLLPCFIMLPLHLNSCSVICACRRCGTGQSIILGQYCQYL